MINWSVVYTEQAEQDLRDIYEYIAFTLLAPANAKGQVNSIIDKIANLNNIPMRHALYEKETVITNIRLNYFVPYGGYCLLF